MFTFDPSCGIPLAIINSSRITCLTINRVHKYQKKDRHEQTSITKNRNVNFISGHKTCRLIGDISSKRSYKLKVMMARKKMVLQYH